MKYHVQLYKVVILEKAVKNILPLLFAMLLFRNMWLNISKQDIQTDPVLKIPFEEHYCANFNKPCLSSPPNRNSKF